MLTAQADAEKIKVCDQGNLIDDDDDDGQLDIIFSYQTAKNLLSSTTTIISC